jgi:hypothetical protein
MMEEYTYAKWFAALVATSIMIHSNTNIYTILIDKIPITGVVLYGGKTWFEQVSSKTNTEELSVIGFHVPLMTFAAVCVFYLGGYCITQFCYHPEHKIATRYHAVLHIISSIGHHAILLLL